MSPLYLSRLALSASQRQVQRELADCYAMHQRILSAFPDGLTSGHAREELGVLYRIEQSTGRTLALVQSRPAPDWSHLPDGYLMALAAVKRIDPFNATLGAGTSLLFRLRANPTRRISERNTNQAERWRGKRVDLRREEEQIAWLARRGERSGFALLTVRARPEISDVRVAQSLATRGYKPAGGQLAFGSVVFEGRLRVTDADAFRAALEGGIGSGKAFGFGLLSVAPVRGEADE